MLPDFSKPAFSSVALASLRFRQENEGGNPGPFRSDYRCQLRYLSDSSDWGTEARVYFVGREAASSGEVVPALIAFLDWANQGKSCQVGSEFELLEDARVTASGIVHGVVSR